MESPGSRTIDFPMSLAGDRASLSGAFDLDTVGEIATQSAVNINTDRAGTITAKARFFVKSRSFITLGFPSLFYGVG
jgi:hypothetical protein